MITPLSLNTIVNAVSNATGLYVAAVAYVAVAGIQTMGGKSLSFADRDLIGRYTLMNILVLAVMGVVLWTLRNEGAERAYAANDAPAHSVAHAVDLHG
jgi:hypothetical protein